MQPIHFATMCEQQDVISALVEQYGADPNSKSEVKTLHDLSFKH